MVSQSTENIRRDICLLPGIWNDFASDSCICLPDAIFPTLVLFQGVLQLPGSTALEISENTFQPQVHWHRTPWGLPTELKEVYLSKWNYNPQPRCCLGLLGLFTYRVQMNHQDQINLGKTGATPNAQRI